MLAPLLVILALAAPLQTIQGKVVRVADGDTITVVENQVQHKIRLFGIDAPERGQAFGTKSKEALSDKVFSKEVKIEWREKDRYGRIVGTVMLDGKSVNEQMVAEGWAWHFVRYSKDKALAQAEKEAREAKRGLWADAHPIEPWEYRRTEKK